MNPRLKFKREDTPLFDFWLADAERDADAKGRAEAKRDRGMSNAAIGAEILDPGFNERALAHVEQYASVHHEFMAEDCRESFKGGGATDLRAWGPVFSMAQSRGLIETSGYAPANSSNRSPKCKWRSKVYGGSH